MKKILLIIALLVCVISFSQTKILKKNVPTITTDMTSGISGASNPNIVAVTTEADLYNIENVGKELNIQSNITLTANRVLADGCKITYGGGVIDVSTFDVTFVNNDVADSKWDFSSGTINDASTFSNVYSINLENYGLVGDGNITTNTGTDNRNTILQASKISHISECDIRIEKEGNYLYTLIAGNDYATTPNNFYIQGKASLYLGKNVVLGALTSAVSSYEVLCVYGGKNNRVYGEGKIVGELRTHDFATHGASESCHGIVINNLSDNVSIEIEIKEVPGDCVIAKYNPNFVHYNTVIEAAFTKDFTINSDGTTTANTDFAYSQRWDVTNSNFNLVGGFVFGGSSFSGWFGLDIQQYSVAFYDNTSIDGDTTTGFISLLPLVQTYEKIPLPTNTTHIRLIINTPTVWGDLLGSIYAPNISRKIIVKSPLLTYGVRQGISNLPPYSIIDGVLGIQNGRRFDGTTGSPGYFFDSEDGYQNLHHIKIINNTFRDNKGGDIILKGSRYFEIANNFFDYSSIPNFVSVNSIELANSEYTSFHDNIVNDRTIALGRGTNFYANVIKDVSFTFTYENEHVHDIINAENIVLGEMIDVDYTGRAKLSNSNFFQTKPLNSSKYPFYKYRNLDIENVIFDFNGFTYNTTTHKLNSLSGSEEALGSMNNVKILNLTAESTNSGDFQTYVYDITDTEIQTNTSIRRGAAKDFTHTNLKVLGWFEIALTDYPATNTGDFTTYTLINPYIVAVAGVGVGGRYAFSSALKDVNIEVVGGYIEFPANNNMLNMLNYGTKHFTDTVFYSATTRSQTLDATYEFTNCTFTNITFTGATIN